MMTQWTENDNFFNCIKVKRIITNSSKTNYAFECVFDKLLESNLMPWEKLKNKIGKIDNTIFKLTDITGTVFVVYFKSKKKIKKFEITHLMENSIHT